MQGEQWFFCITDRRKIKVDELLLRRAQQGDTEAFEQLLTPLEKMIWRVCWHYTEPAKLPRGLRL